MKVQPKEITVPWLPFKAHAMTIFPYIFYWSGVMPVDMPCLRVHEMVHWRHQKNSLLLLWLLSYALLFLLVNVIAKKGIVHHPLETPAYVAQWKCQGLTDDQINLNLGKKV